MKHQEIFAIIASKDEDGIIVMHDGPIFCPAVALDRKNIERFALKAKQSVDELGPGRRLFVVRFSNPEIMEVIE